ncbi:Transcription initiation factor IIEbeta subunit [Aphelenchoides avenae]|nr:Transcription initiation factor IIEbeta subunit [Aphelenchus avenae]
MDPELLKQRQSFMKSALKSMPVQQRPAQPSSSHTTFNVEEKKKKKKHKPSAAADAQAKAELDYKKAESVSNAANFAVMAKIVDYMKKRHLQQQAWSLSLKDILEEMSIFDLTKRAEAWLRDALPKNPRLTVDAEEKYIYKPPYKIRNRNTLLLQLKKNHTDLKPGLLLTELNDCIPDAEKHVKLLGDQLIDIPTQVNKRKDHVYFFNDPDVDFKPDEDLVRLWRGAKVDHLDENKVEEYLQKHGITTFKELAPKRSANAAPKRKAVKRKINAKVQNVHLDGVLENYDA